MLIIPAIDIQDGCVVRLVQGRADKKVYSRDPLKTAKHWVKQGAKFLHIVDLDGAFSGSPKNLNTAREIAGNIGIPVEFGGGVRSEETIKMLIDGGVRRVVLGTKAVQDKSFLKKAFSRFGDRVIVSIDAKGGDVLIEGGKSSSKGIKALEFAKYLKELGFTQIIYTDTQKDGTLTGPNIKGVKALLKETGLKIISSGG
ncbi:MAG: 1-(5-phosphoribosyl)-5-((5-phosphoribosylamino)methylideneamino)imidazole-4-carboxamide isomerase, partial [Candidatus Omnitrophica bacterium]|nr:1-(5-phosphoribosyl)-5-((5-phosphoribosylamino)methylideneamino)imidazole-4-carboxamide isomerase [Candidatus Omnitrophota bacterium]